MSEHAAKWIFRIDVDAVHDLRPYLPAGWNQGWAFLDREGNRWLEIRPDGSARILAGYAWDGCTPKLVVFDLVCGTPDGVPNVRTGQPKAYFASLFHDALYQFLDAKLPLSRAQADRVFLDLLARDRFAPRRIYWLAVRAFGGLFRLFTRWKRDYASQRVPL